MALIMVDDGGSVKVEADCALPLTCYQAVRERLRREPSGYILRRKQTESIRT
jgi:hypothetical protein